MSARLTATKRGRDCALAFLTGVRLIVLLGLFSDLRPSYEVDGESVTLDMTATIVMVMFAVGVAILFARPPGREAGPRHVGVQGRHGRGDRVFEYRDKPDEHTVGGTIH